MARGGGDGRFREWTQIGGAGCPGDAAEFLATDGARICTDGNCEDLRAVELFSTLRRGG
jgi:hypothetical protein